MSNLRYRDIKSSTADGTFGGVKGTGNGHREAGKTGLDIFTEWKTVYVDYSGRLQRAQIDTEEILEEERST